MKNVENAEIHLNFRCTVPANDFDKSNKVQEVFCVRGGLIISISIISKINMSKNMLWLTVGKKDKKNCAKFGNDKRTIDLIRPTFHICTAAT